MKFRIVLRDKGGLCMRSRELEANEVQEELPKFVERNSGYFQEGLEQRFEEQYFAVESAAKHK